MRNPEYQFIPTDTGALVSLLTSAYERITKSTVRPSSPEWLYIWWAAHVIIQERVLTNYAGNQNIPSRAEGANLDALAELTRCKARPEAKAAACKMRFEISVPLEYALLIPAGTRVTDVNGALVWDTGQDHYIPAGETFAEAEVRCQTPGAVGNEYTIGQINQLVDVFPYFARCGNITASDGGSDVPTDEEYYELLRASMDAYSCAGARGSYIYWARQVSTRIADVAVNSPTPGVVKLYVLMDDGTPASEELKGKVLAACSADEVRPLTDQVFVEDAEAVPYDIQLTYYVPKQSMKSGAEIAEAVREAVDQYVSWQCGKLGRDINPSRLISLIMAAGIKRVDVAAPAYSRLRDGNPALGADMSCDQAEMIPQLARLRSMNILNGGYEDE